MTKSPIVHVEFKNTGVHHYFGSIAAIYSVFDPKTLGVSYSRLKGALWQHDGYYSNRTIIVRKGTMIRSPQSGKD